MNAHTALSARLHVFALGYTSPRGTWVLAWTSWCAVVVVFTAVAIASWWTAHANKLRRQAIELQTIELQRAAVPSKPPEPVGDFASSLGPALPAARFIGELERACAREGVVLANQSAAHHDGSAAELGRQEFRVTLRAGYGPIKQVLRHMLARFEQATLRSMRLRHDASGNVVDAGLVFSLWSPPAPAGSGPIPPLVR